MKRIALVAILTLLLQGAFAQRGDELLVYAVKGTVTAVYKKTESKVKIGKVLKQGTVIKTQKDASLTMLCTKGKPISLSKEGSFPIARWRDSCRTTSGSVTANYFKYIWDQLYAYSPEHKEEMRKKNNMAVSRGDPPAVVRPVKFTKLEFKPAMDTVNYDGEPFPLSWKGAGYRDYYHFTLYDAKAEIVLYADSLRNSFIAIDSFKHLLTSGETYRWTVRAKGVPVSKKRVLNYVDTAVTRQLTDALLQPIPIPEDSATTSLRVAYILEQRHFFAAAYKWYQEAARQETEMPLYRDQLIRFRNDYWIR